MGNIQSENSPKLRAAYEYQYLIAKAVLIQCKLAVLNLSNSEIKMRLNTMRCGVGNSNIKSPFVFFFNRLLINIVDSMCRYTLYDCSSFTSRFSN